MIGYIEIKKSGFFAYSYECNIGKSYLCYVKNILHSITYMSSTSNEYIICPFTSYTPYKGGMALVECTNQVPSKEDEVSFDVTVKNFLSANDGYSDNKITWYDV